MNSGDYNNNMLISSNSQWALQPEELQFAHLLLNQSEEAAFCIGANGQFIYVNNATCRMTEYSREELLSMTIDELDVDFSPQIWAETVVFFEIRGFCYF